MKKNDKCVISNTNEETREEYKMAKKTIDKKKLFTRIMAAVLALLMVLGVAATLIYYITTP